MSKTRISCYFHACGVTALRQIDGVTISATGKTEKEARKLLQEKTKVVEKERK